MTTPNPITVAATVVADTTRPSLLSLLLVSERDCFPSPPLSDSLVPVSLRSLERDSLEPPSSELCEVRSLESPDSFDESPDPFDESPEPFDESPEPFDESPEPEPEPEPSDEPSDALIPPFPIAPGVLHPVTANNTTIPNALAELLVVIPDTLPDE
ncbi:hypothetical protein MFU01_17420 [Myxococcus fulvus]|uniref:Uncharacterized protein n=1 Tax=Myxococcus fulvus TaxID=33 RepID=A0A511SXR0_MYXFU|nr:hypothetical protein MFU01_17420 [Myxococcus fulvus]